MQATSRPALCFGKIDDDMYTLDARAPLSPLHAFAIALSTFEGSAAAVRAFLVRYLW